MCLLWRFQPVNYLHRVYLNTKLPPQALTSTSYSHIVFSTPESFHLPWLIRGTVNTAIHYDFSGANVTLTALLNFHQIAFSNMSRLSSYSDKTLNLCGGEILWARVPNILYQVYTKLAVVQDQHRGCN
jgi:hypothetical protein